MRTYAQNVSTVFGIAFIITFPSSTASVCERCTPTSVRTFVSFLSDWNAQAKSFLKNAFAPWSPLLSPMAPSALALKRALFVDTRGKVSVAKVVRKACYI